MIKVLVVDDEVFVRRGIVLETDWADMDCMVVGEADNGLSGVAAAKRYEPDLIISDIRMPQMDGIEMLRHLREEGSRVHVVFLTAYSDFSYAQSAIKLSASDYLLKPFEDGELERAIGRIREQIAREREEGLPPLIRKGGDKSRYIVEAISYISRHYGDDDISIGAIAESIGISEGHLSHLFKKETEYTVMAYITRCRMNAAAKLLSDCRYKVYEVAEKVGYRDITYFSSAFKKMVGVSPSEYQNRCTYNIQNIRKYKEITALSSIKH